MSLSLKKLYGGAGYSALGSDLTLYPGSPRVWRVAPSASGRKINLPAPALLVPGDVPRFVVLNEGSQSVSVESGYQVTLLASGNVGRFFHARTCGGSYAERVLADAAVGYWKLGEPSGAYADSSGNGNNGADAGTGGTTTRAADGLVSSGGAAVKISHAGTNRVSIADAATFTLATLSVEAWVKLDAVPTGAERHWLVSKFVNPAGFIFEAIAGGWRGWIGAGGTATSITSSAAPTTGTSHLVLTYDGSNIRLYVNGVSAASAVAKSGSVPDTAIALDVGGWAAAGFGAGGTVDEVAIYSGALSAERVASHYAAGLGGSMQWFGVQSVTGAARPVTASPAWTDPCTVVDPVPPDPPPPPPPYHGQSCDLSSCPATKTVTVASGTGAAAIWNGVWTVTKTGSPAYYRLVLDEYRHVDLRCFVGGGGYGYKWQVQLKDATGTGVNKRFGNNDSGACPPNGAYTCFPVPSENADCTTGGSPTCVVSA